MKKYTFIIWLLLSVCLGASAALQTDVKTPLLRSLAHSKSGDVERLKILYQLVQATKVDPQVRTYYVEQMLKEAEVQKNNEYKCQAYLIHMFISYNMFDVKAVNYWMSLLDPLARKEKLYDLLFQGRRCIIDFYQISEEYEREEREAKEMLKEATEVGSKIGIVNAYQCIASAYAATYRTNEAIEALVKALQISMEIKDHGLVFEAAGTLVESFEQINDDNNRLKYIQIQDVYITQMLKEQPALREELSASILDMNIAFLSYYTDIGDYVKAEKYRRLAEELNKGKYGIYSYRYHSACYKLYDATHNFEKALEENSFILNIFKELSPYSYIYTNYKRAGLFVKFEHYDEALALYKRLDKEKDSIQVSILNKQVEQVRKNYNADNLLLEKQRINLYINLISISVVFIVCLVIVGFLIRNYRVRKTLRKSEHEMRGMAEEMELMNQAKERFLSSISANISQPLNGVVDGSLCLITNDNLDDNERKKISDEITQTSDDLMKLINNILDLSRLEAGMMKFSLLDLELVNFINSFTISLAASSGQQIRTVLPEGEVMLNIDVTRLSELMTRVLSNRDKESEEMVLEVQLSVDGSSAEFHITGTALASVQPSQDTIIMNEINRLFVERCKGCYHIEKGVSVIFSLPINVSPVQ